MDNQEKMSSETEAPKSRELDLNYIIYLQDLGRPIKREDLTSRDIVIPPDAFSIIGSLEIINVDGEVITIDLSDNISDRPLVIKPSELGE